MALNRKTKAVSTQKGKPATSKAKKAESVIDALCTALSKGHSNKAKMFLHNVPDVNATGEAGRTPLECAVEVGDRKLVDLLLEHGADVNGRDDFGETALFVAALSGSSEMVYRLLEHGAMVNIKSNAGVANGETPLHHAVFSASTDVVTLLLSHGANANAKDMAGQTPLDTALSADFQDLTALLRRHKANPPSTLFQTPQMTETAFNPCRGQAYKFQCGELSTDDWKRMGWRTSMVLFMFGTRRMSLNEGNLFLSNRSRPLPFIEYREKMEISGRGRTASLTELCAGFHVLLAITGRCGVGAPMEPADLGWPAGWQKTLQQNKREAPV